MQTDPDQAHTGLQLPAEPETEGAAADAAAVADVVVASAAAAAAGAVDHKAGRT